MAYRRNYRRSYHQRKRRNYAWLTIRRVSSGGAVKVFNENGDEVDGSNAGTLPFPPTNEVLVERVVGTITLRKASAGGAGVIRFGNCNAGSPYMRVNVSASPDDQTVFSVNQKTRHKITGADLNDVLARLIVVDNKGFNLVYDFSINVLISVE